MKRGGRPKQSCPCGVASCRDGSSPGCYKRLRAKLAQAKRVNALVLPSRDRCEAVEAQVTAFEAALAFHKEKARLLDVDLTQRYIIVQELALKLSSLIGPEQTEAFIRATVRAPFVRTLGPLDGIFRAMHANELAGQAAAQLPEPYLPPGFHPVLRGYSPSNFRLNSRAWFLAGRRSA